MPMHGEKLVAYQRAYRERNREKLRALNRAWRLKNREALKISDREKYERKRGERIAVQREYYQRHHETRLAWHREYRLKNRETMSAARKTEEARAVLAERQARRRTARSPWANETEIRKVYAEARAKTKATRIKRVVDHVVPLVHPLVCGLHNEFNLRVITQTENAAKNNKFSPTEYRP